MTANWISPIATWGVPITFRL